MSSDKNKVFQIVVKATGKKIQQIHRVLFFYQNEIDWDEGYLQFTFSDGSHLLLKGSANGADPNAVEEMWSDPFSGELDDETLEWIEQYGKYRLVDISTIGNFAKIVGRKIDKIFAIYHNSGILSGFQFAIDDTFMNFMHFADECLIYWGKSNEELIELGFIFDNTTQ